MASKAGLLNVILTTFTITVIPSITLCIKLYFPGTVAYDEKLPWADNSRNSSHVCTIILTSSKFYNKKGYSSNKCSYRTSIPIELVHFSV